MPEFDAYRDLLRQAVDIDGALALAVIDVAAGRQIWSVTARSGGSVGAEVDELLAAVGAGARVAALFDEANSWTELSFLGPERHHVLRPFAQRWIVDLVLDTRTTNLAGARLRLDLLLRPAENPPSAATPGRRVGRNQGIDLAALPDEATLNRVLVALRAL